ncbi:MAG: GH25 family lysozyme [Eubacteriales bacterium]
MKKKLLLVFLIVFIPVMGFTFHIVAESAGQATVQGGVTVLTQSEGGLEVRNVYASEVTYSSATLNISFGRISVSDCTLLLGTSPEAMEEVSTQNLGKAASSLSMTASDLAPHTRYYYAFLIGTEEAVIRTDSWSFVTPDDYYNGSQGGANDENAEYGIDVSFWKGSIDFTKLADQNIDFVILRAGSTKGKDTYFEEHYEQAKAAGLKVGVYYYSYAMNMEEIAQDADWFLEYIAGKTFDLPVYLDIENISQEENLSRPLLTEMAIEFCERIADAGYYPGIYANRNWFTNYLNFDTLSPVYELWIASWTKSGEPDGDYSENYGMWQYSSSGKLDGVNGAVDMNVCYKDYTSLIRQEERSTYGFYDYDGSLLITAEYYPGNRIYAPDLTPARPCDDEYEYTFSGWIGLDENTVADSAGGSFTARYTPNEHAWGDWQEISPFERVKVCENCGRTLSELIDDPTCGQGLTWSIDGETLTVIGNGAILSGESAIRFPWASRATEITKLVISEGVTVIGDHAFDGFTALTEVQLPYTLTTIGEYAFCGDVGLTEIAIPAQVRTISEYAFEGCTALSTVKGYENSAAQTMAESAGVSFVTLSPWLQKSGRFGNGVSWYLYSDGSLLFAGIGAILPDGGYQAYSQQILSVKVGAAITEIPEGAFLDFTSLESVEFLGKNPVKVGDSAFVGCTRLFTINLPRGSEFAENAFDGTPIVSDF